MKIDEDEELLEVLDPVLSALQHEDEDLSLQHEDEVLCSIKVDEDEEQLKSWTQSSLLCSMKKKN